MFEMQLRKQKCLKVNCLLIFVFVEYLQSDCKQSHKIKH